MACKLSDDQLDALYKATVGEIVANKANGQPFSPDAFMKKIYNAIFEATNDVANSLDYVQHIPWAINLAQGIDMEIADYLIDSEVSMDAVNKLRRQFDNVDNIVKYLGLNKNDELETAKEIVEESFPETQVIQTDEYTEIEKKDKDLKEQEIKNNFVQTKDGGFVAKPDSALATISQEAKTYGGLTQKDNVLDDDPQKKAYYKIVRLINNELVGLPNANNLTIGNVTGIFFKAIPTKNIAPEDFYQEHKEFFSKPDSPGIKEDDVSLVFSDREGNILYFNENGDITSKEEGGKPLYTFMRRVYTKSGNKVVYNVQDVESLSLRPGADAVEVLRENRNSEIEILENLRSYVSKNPNQDVLLSITAGKNGYITEDFSNKVRISSIDLGGAFSPYYSSISQSGQIKGGVYFNVSDYPLPVLIHRPKFSEVPNLVESLANILFDSSLPNSQKIKLVKQFTQSKDTAVFEEEGVVKIRQGENILDTTVKADKDIFVQNLNDQTLNINKDLLGGYFTMPVMVNNKLDLQENKNYNNFLADNFYTFLQKNAENKIVKLNAYNTFQLTTDASEKIFSVEQKEKKKTEESVLEQATPSDQSVEDFKKAISKIDTSLKKIKELSSEATEQQIADAEKWYNNSLLSKHVPFSVMLNVVNSDAVAEFTLSGIFLYKGSNFTDLYHEGWHVFSQLFLTKEQKKKLYGEVKKLAGTFTDVKGRTVRFDAATDIQIEEFLAEDYRKYVLSKGTKIFENRPVTNNIFQKIWKFLKALYKGQSIKRILSDASTTGMVKDLYDNLYIGNINEYKPSLSNVQFTVLNKGIQDLDAKPEENKGMNYQDSMVINQTIDSLMASNLSQQDLSVNTVFTNPELLGPLYAKIKYDLSKLKDNFDPEDFRVKMIDKALENWGDFSKVIQGEEQNGVIAFHRKRSDFLGFDEKYSELTLDEQNDEDGNVSDPDVTDDSTKLEKKDAELREQFGEKVGERKGNENSVLEIASNQTVYLIKSLPALDKNGNIEYNILGVPKLVEFNRMWGILINTVAGSINKTDMYNKIVAGSAVFPELKVLAERLKDPISKSSVKTDAPYIQMWGAFFRDFSVYKVPIKELQVIRQLSDGESVFAVRFVESEPLFQQVKNNFTNAFQTSASRQYIKRDVKGFEGVNVLNLEKVFEDFPSASDLQRGETALKFLKAVGFYMTDNKFVRNNLFKNNNLKKVGFIYDRLKRAYESKTVIQNPIAFLESNEISKNANFNGRNNGKDVKTILDIEGMYSTNYGNNSIMNVNGDREYDLSLNNSLTQFLKEINDPQKAKYQDVVSQPHMAHLDFRRNPNAKYSSWVSSMFDIPKLYGDFSVMNQGFRKTENGVASTLNVVNLNGIKSVIDEIGKTQYSDGGIKTANLDGNSKFLLDLHTMLESGVMELSRRAAKSSSYGVSVSNLRTPYNENDRTSYISVGHFADDNTSTDYAVKMLKEKLAAEMERIAIVKDDIKNNGELSKIPGFAERAIKFMAFDDMLGSDKTLKEDLIKAADQEDSFSIVNSLEFSGRISMALSKYLESLYKENMEIYNEMPFLSTALRNKIRKAAKDDGHAILDSKLEQVAIKAFTVNALIHNLEVAAVLDGDLANFNHDKEEYNKRNAYITSTGRIFSFDASDIKVLNSEDYFNATYAKAIGAAKKDFNGTLNSAVFKDNILKSVYHEEYVNALVKTGKYTKDEAEKILEPYVGMNEGDGQGWITFDAYRTLSILEGNKWTPKQGELYSKIVKGEEVSPEDIYEFFPPLKFQYAGPLKTDKLDVRAFHKFSLAPLIPSIIKGTNMEIFHDNLVKQGIDYALFESGSKMSTLTNDGSADSFYENDNYDSRKINPWADGKPMYKKNPVFIQYLKNQVDIAPTWKGKTIFSTQLRKLIINDIFLKGLPINEDFNKLVADFEKNLNELQSFKKQELLQEIGWVTDEKGNPKGNIADLVKFVKKELSRQGLPDHVVEFIDLDDSGKKLRYDLSYSLAAEQIEKLLNAIVVKRLIRQKLNGEQLIQVSGSGFETSNRSAFTKATEEQLKKYRGTNDLPTYRPGKGKNGATTAMKVKVAINGDYYKLLELNSVKDFARKNNVTPLEALNTLIKNDKWLDEGDNRKLVTMVAVRIPVQGLNSMEFMEIYEFLPEEAGNILIPPTEIVAKSGSDFDIDKLTVFQPNYEGNKDYAKLAKGDNVKGVENNVIDSIRKILEHPDNFVSLVRPNDTDLVKGVANDLAKENIQGFDPFANKTIEGYKKGKKGNVISPTRVLEPRYNIYKHDSNNIGKKTLGIGAVDNAYSSIFKRIGARMMPEYTFRPFDKEKKPHTRKVNIAFDHNKTTIDGVEYTSLSDIETITGKKISDIIAQLMNGWVDIEKDAWIFNINGNNIAGPVLLFLLETGVDFKTAAHFVSQPLIIEYIKQRFQSDSPFYEPSGKGKRQQRGLNKFAIRKNMIKEYIGPLPVITRGERAGQEFLSGEVLYKNFIKPNTENLIFTQEALLKNIKSKDLKSDVSKKALLHFFELEDMMAQLTNVKLTVNVDTAPSKTFLDAQTRLINIEGLNKTDIIPSDMVERIKTDSPISSFFIQKFQLNLFRPLMKLRADEKINNFLIKQIESETFKSTFPDANKFAVTFKNDIPLYQLHNYLKGVNLDSMKEYSSIGVDSNIPVQEAQLKYGAFVKNDVMYIDKAQIKEDFKNKAYAGAAYEERGLYKVPEEHFTFFKNNDLDFQEYAHFVLEREYLRSVTSAEGKTREQFEKEIAETALENTYNFYSILKSPSSIANVFTQIKESATSDISKNYMIFDQIAPSKLKSDKAVNTLKMKSAKLDKDMANTLHENLLRLSDPGTIKLADPTRNANMSAFFRKFIVAEYMRSGTAKGTDSLSSILPTDILMKLLREPMQSFEVTDEFLKKYYSAFLRNWSSASKEKRNKIRNYLQVNELNIPELEAADNSLVMTDDKGLNSYVRPITIEGVKSIIQNNPGYVFVYPTNEAGIDETLSLQFQKGSSIGIPVKPKGGRMQKWSDASYDSNVEAINNSLNKIQQTIENGQSVVFPQEGLTDVVDKDKSGQLGSFDVLQQSAPRTFEYLATELYKRFGYVHPGAEKLLGFRTIYQTGQEISDVEVDEFIKKCFGE